MAGEATISLGNIMKTLKVKANGIKKISKYMASVDHGIECCALQFPILAFLFYKGTAKFSLCMILPS